MRKIIKQVIGTIMTLVILFAVIWAASVAVKRPDSDEKYYDFFRKDTDYDVLFLGSSHGMNAFFPMQLWNDYGYTSFNFGNHAATVKNSYWVLKNAVEYHKPKIVVYDVYSATWEDTSTMDISQAHFSFDAFPFSATKVQGLRELFKGSDFWELVFPFSVYHSRWQEITLEDVKRNFYHTVHNYEKGAESRIHVAVAKEYEQIPQEQMSTEITEPMEQLERMIEYCQQNGMEIILVNVPSPSEVLTQERSNAIQLIANNYAVPYLNLEYSDVINFDTDMYDSDSHINPGGARKVTEYVGNYLKEKYSLRDKRKDAKYEIWNSDYDSYYEKVLVENLTAEENLNSFLMLLNNEAFTAEIRTSEDYRWRGVREKLLAAIEDSVEVTEDPEIKEDDAMVITVYNSETKEEVCARKFVRVKDNYVIRKVSEKKH